MEEEHTTEGTYPRCRNCASELAPDAKYCNMCGQRNTDGRISFGQLALEFIANLFNFDGRIFQTLGALAVPGKLTKDFFAGKQIRYYHPVRLFILSGALFIAMLSVQLSKADIDGVDQIWKSREEAYALKKVMAELDTLCTEIVQESGNAAVPVALDSLKARFSQKHLAAKKDSIEITDVINFGSNAEDAGKKVALTDLMSMKEKDLADKYEVNGFWERQIFLQNLRIQKGMKGFIFYMIGNILWMVLVMMPMLALVLKLLYVRRPFLYIEHLIFSFHTHTFFFLLSSLLVAIGMWVGNQNPLLWGLLVGGFYPFFAMKRFYGQTWGKTTLKYLIASILYLAVAVLAMLLVTLVSLFLF